ncbi:hypothetical protein KORDIASMS9_01564 [Kordia sp. SMS9]|uniref:hypothetical protein n=1 Tax=Kordia sp. SMS9 TaxID=2282170 RepID=UPI000E10BFA9|nr:hypothetical protein [Kordia sp. SMS9]AXG69344.1 hypothetical protein KORDIASMS9_01564 [Kordia sp. SMS9]
MIKRALLLTIILHSIIFIGIPEAHGYVVMVMFDFISIPAIIRNGIEFSKGSFLGNSLMLIGLISLIGKIILIRKLFSKKIAEKKVAIYIGLVLLFVAFIVIIIGVLQIDTFLVAVTFGSGIPFLMYAGRVVYLLQKK